MKKKTLKIICLAACIGLIFAFVMRYYDLNFNQFPNPIIVKHKIGETIDGGNVSILVTDYQMLTRDEFKGMFPDYEESLDILGNPLENDEVYHLLVTMKLVNHTDEVQYITPFIVAAESLIWTNGLDREEFNMMNEEGDSVMRVEIGPNKSKEIILPYNVYNFHFKEKDWKNIRSRKFDITLSHYPVKHIIELN